VRCKEIINLEVVSALGQTLKIREYQPRCV
jgi:hypothetical protein